MPDLPRVSDLRADGARLLLRESGGRTGVKHRLARMESLRFRARVRAGPYAVD